MKQLISAKGTYLLEAPLEILHEQSLEWLQEIEFWKDEAAFFYALILRKSKEATPLLKTKQAKDVEKHLIYVSSEKLDDLKMEVESHEKFLARIMENVKLDERLYRTRHKGISKQFQNFEVEFREMKKKIFQFVEKWKPVKIAKAKNYAIELQ